jgi:hypothetical protein
MAEALGNERSAGSRGFWLLAGAGILAIAALPLMVPGATAQRYIPGLSFDYSGYWPLGLHLMTTAGAGLAGIWLRQAAGPLPRPGAIPLTAFALLQFSLLCLAFLSFALAATAVTIRGGPYPLGVLLVLPGAFSLAIHNALLSTFLRHRAALSPLYGGALIFLALASNFVPLFLILDAVAAYFRALAAVLYLREAAEPLRFAPGVWELATSFSAQEQRNAGVAALGCAALAGAWTWQRYVRDWTQRRVAAVLSPFSIPQQHFLEDAFAASSDALSSRTNAKADALWALVWMAGVAPALLVAGYWCFQNFPAWREAFALSALAVPGAEFAAFATADWDAGGGALAAGCAAFALFMRRPMASLFLPSARFDALAAQGAEALTLALARAIGRGEIGPGSSFDADAFVERLARPRVTLPALVTLCAVAGALGVAGWDLNRAAAFTASGIVVREDWGLRKTLAAYEAVQAVAIGCTAAATGPKPSYVLHLPGGRTIEMIGGAPLDQRLDQYLSVDRRLRYAGVGFAYMPGDVPACLKAVEDRYNAVIAAGTGRLLHALN